MTARKIGIIFSLVPNLILYATNNHYHNRNPGASYLAARWGRRYRTTACRGLTPAHTARKRHRIPQNEHGQMKITINAPTEKPLAVIPLTPEQRAAITSKAKAAGLSEAQYLSRFLTQAINAATESNQISTDK